MTKTLCSTSWSVRLIASTLLVLGFVAAPSAAQYPTRPIKVVVPYPPGGSSDLMTRTLQRKLEQILGQSLIVENTEGAGGVVGTQNFKAAEPDGYTILMSTNSELILAKLMKSSIKYDASSDFTPISLIGTGPIVVIARPDLPADTWSKTIAMSKSAATGLNYGSPGANSTWHIAGEILKANSGLSAVHVPFRGGGPLITAVLGGHVDLGVITLAPAMATINSGGVRPLIILSKERASFAPNIPTASESGMPDIDLETWWGVLAPKGIPTAIAAKLEAALKEVVKDPAIRQKLHDQAVNVRGLGQQEFRDFIVSETNKYLSFIKQTKLPTE